MILVTGSSGLVGRAVVRQLMGQGLPVRSLVHEAPMPRLSRFPGSEPEQVVGDVRDPGSLQAACEGVETVIHLVAVLRRRRDGDYRAINVEGTRNLLAAAEAAGARRFILVSALGATPDPRYAYAHSKWQAEELVRASSLAWTIFRPSLLFGEGGGFFEKLRQSLRFSPPGLAFVPRTQARFQPLAAADLARCIRISLTDPSTHEETFELGGPQAYTLAEMARLLLRVMDRHRLVVQVPIPVVRLAAWAGSRLIKEPPLTQQELELLTLAGPTDPDLIPRRFGFQPQELEAGLEALYGPPTP